MPRLNPADFAKAKTARLPRTLKPQLATLASEPPLGNDWLHELKYDGYRVLTHFRDSSIRLMTRNGNDWTKPFSAVGEACRGLSIDDGILDGEVVVLREDGTTDFQALQNVMRNQAGGQLVYYVFDVPYFGGFDLRAVPLMERKSLLQELLPSDNLGVVRYSDHIVGQGDLFFRQASQCRIEGIVSKKQNSVYESRRTATWLKVKCFQQQEFVIGGWTDPSGSRTGFGALLLGYYDDGALRYCGRVGTGFSEASLDELIERLDGLAAPECPFDPVPDRREARDWHWVEPSLVASVRFADWTEDDRLRHPSFQGLRADKPPREITREQEVREE